MDDVKTLQRLQNKGFEVVKKELHITLVKDKDDADIAKVRTLVLSQDDIAEVENLDSKDDKALIKSLRQDKKDLKAKIDNLKAVLKK